MVNLSDNFDPHESLVYFLNVGKTIVTNAASVDTAALLPAIEAGGDDSAKGGQEDEKQIISLCGADIMSEHAVITRTIQIGSSSIVTILPLQGKVYINGQPVVEETVVEQGHRVAFGFSHIFRFNDPVAAAAARAARLKRIAEHPSQQISLDISEL